MKRLILAVSLAFLPYVLSAQEPANKPERDMTPWLWANFAILAAGLGYLFKKYGTPFLAARSESISKDLLDAEKAQAQANAKVAEINARLANLDSEVAAIKDEFARERTQEVERLRARHQSELARISQQTRREIESTAKAARVTLRKHAAKLAVDLAEQKVRARMNPEVQKKLTLEFVESLSTQGKLTPEFVESLSTQGNS
jgi:F-type H+-transporting ATPase subunit b